MEKKTAAVVARTLPLKIR